MSKKTKKEESNSKKETAEEKAVENSQAEGKTAEHNKDSDNAAEEENTEADVNTETKEEALDEKQEIDPLEAAEQQAREWQDKYLRLSADFDNYRKRTLKEKMEMTKTASAGVITDILPVMDDFDRARDSMSNSQDIDAVKDGINLIYNKLLDFFKQEGVKEIEAKEKEFNVDLHEAVTKIPAPEEKLKGKVVDVIQKGYYLGDKVIRYAKVVVGE